MNNKVLTNFRDHPSLRYDDPQSLFKIDDKVYLISEGVVRQIMPRQMVNTNIGEPYKALTRFYFVFADDSQKTYMESIDFAPKHEESLRQLLEEPQTLMESLDKVGLLC
jgi:hypothetical protein